MDPAERAKTTVERLKPELTLTEQQEKDITPIYTEYYTSFKKIMESGTRPTPEERQKLTGERNDKLKKVLSEDQMKKLAEVEEKCARKDARMVAVAADRTSLVSKLANKRLSRR